MEDPLFVIGVNSDFLLDDVESWKLFRLDSTFTGVAGSFSSDVIIGVGFTYIPFGLDDLLLVFVKYDCSSISSFLDLEDFSVLLAGVTFSGR